MNREEKIMKRVQEHYDYLQAKGFEIVFLALQGSQNYGLDIYEDDYMSDIDTKAVVLPTFGDFVNEKKGYSNTLILSNNEHIDVKDIRVMFECFKKQNINFLEILFTNYKIINPKYKNLIQPLFDNAERIAHLNTNQAIRCMAGMSMEKLKALQHPYPGIIEKIEKYNYDPKQLHHILRMNDFIKEYINNVPFKECLISKRSLYLKEIKKGILPVKEAVKLATETDEDTKKIKDENILEKDIVDDKALDILTDIKFKILSKTLKEELIKNF